MWNRCNKNKPCSVCGKFDWCTYTDDGAHRCMRIVNASKWQLIKVDSAGGNIYRGIGETSRRIGLPTPPALKPKVAWEHLCKKWVNRNKAWELANTLGVVYEGLAALMVGWSEMHKSYTFPMRDENAKIVGVRLRTKDNKKFSIKGSREGCFYPDPKHIEMPHEVFVVEGASDAAAILSIGGYAIGRSSATGCKQIIKSLVQGRRVIIIGDTDEVGMRGANDLASEIFEGCEQLHIVFPSGAKDARDWIRQGASLDEIKLRSKEGDWYAKEEQVSCRSKG